MQRTPAQDAFDISVESSEISMIGMQQSKNIFVRANTEVNKLNDYWDTPLANLTSHNG
jgi:hypothetical protein